MIHVKLHFEPEVCAESGLKTTRGTVAGLPRPGSQMHGGRSQRVVRDSASAGRTIDSQGWVGGTGDERAHAGTPNRFFLKLVSIL